MRTFITSVIIVGCVASAAVAQTNIDAASKFSWSENAGWTNWHDAGDPAGAQGVRIDQTFLSGHVWAENVGWINLGDGAPADAVAYANADGADFGVNLDSAGELFGLAWGENVGWINFEGGALADPPQPARFDCDGILTGFVWGENIGWINLSDAAHYVAMVLGSPTATITGAALLKEHGGAVGSNAIPVNLGGVVESANVTSEPRQGGITELEIQFNVPPGGSGPALVEIEEQTCAACPCSGTDATYSPYAGASDVQASITDTALLLSFTPGLENGRTYRITMCSDITSIAGQSIEVRALMGDANSDGRVNGTDRSTVVGVWTSPDNYSPQSDINLDGRTNATDRSIVVSAWTGGNNCAP